MRSTRYFSGEQFLEDSRVEVAEDEPSGVGGEGDSAPRFAKDAGCAEEELDKKPEAKHGSGWNHCHSRVAAVDLNPSLGEENEIRS